MTGLASGKMPEAKPSDDDLVRRACAGEVSAFEQLVRRHAAMAIGAAFRITRDQGLAEDAAQEAFLKAFRALPAYKEQQTFAGWLRTITVRCALDTVRRRRPEVRIERKEEQRFLVDDRFERDRKITAACNMPFRNFRHATAKSFSRSKRTARVSGT